MGDVVVLAEPEPVADNRSETALFLLLVLAHDVLKWLHHLLLKYVILWHFASFSHDFWHASRLETLPGDVSRYTSPLSWSHAVEEPTSTHAFFAPVGLASVKTF